MELSEIYADESGETHFRRTELALEPRDFAPPSKPLMVSAEITLTTGRFLVAPPGWDDAYHATPRKQLAFVLSGSVTVTATDGESIVMRPGDLLLLNDTNSKGHLTRVQGQADHCALMIGLKDDGT